MARCRFWVPLFVGCSLRSFILALVGSTFLLSFSLVPAFAQGDPAAGIQPFSTNEFGVDLATDNLNLSIPIRSKPTLSVALVGNFHPYQDENGLWVINVGLQSVGNGLQGYSIVSGGSMPHGTCHGFSDYLLLEFSVQDWTGATHALPVSFKMDSGGCMPPPATGTTTDGSGLTVVTGGSSDSNSWKIYDSSGNSVNQGAVKTPDGVVLVSATGGTYKDALSSTAVLTATVSGSMSSTADTYSYTDASGTLQTIPVNKTGYYQWTAFSCDSGAGNMQHSYLSYFPTTIQLPGSAGSYSISYEQTPGKSSSYVTGRIAKITYPSGGSISYAYQGGLQYLCSGGPNVLQVTVNDGQGHNSVYTYTYPAFGPVPWH